MLLEFGLFWNIYTSKNIRAYRVPKRNRIMPESTQLIKTLHYHFRKTHSGFLFWILIKNRNIVPKIYIPFITCLSSFVEENGKKTSVCCEKRPVTFFSLIKPTSPIHRQLLPEPGDVSFKSPNDRQHYLSQTLHLPSSKKKIFRRPFRTVSHRILYTSASHYTL